MKEQHVLADAADFPDHLLHAVEDGVLLREDQPVAPIGDYGLVYFVRVANVKPVVHRLEHFRHNLRFKNISELCTGC